MHNRISVKLSVNDFIVNAGLENDRIKVHCVYLLCEVKILEEFVSILC